MTLKKSRERPRARRRLRSRLAAALISVLVPLTLLVPTASSTAEERLFRSSEVPATLVQRDTAKVELGMRFRVTRPGKVVGMRFYDTPANTGPHVGHLWTARGRLLATGTFARGARYTGWRTLTFARPARLQPDQWYVVSYVAPRGRYASTRWGFASRRTSGSLVAPVRAGVFNHGGGFPRDTWRASNYFVDVRFVPDPAPKPPPSPEPVAGTLALPRQPWHGGPAYYAKFPKAAAAGWADPAHFPIAVFFGKPSHASALAGLGINTYMAAEHDGSAMSTITSRGISVLAQLDEWTRAEVGNDTRVVGWHVSDECEMGMGPCSTDDEYRRLAIQKGWVDRVRSFGDGRLVQANFGNGVLGTWWAPNTMDDHLSLMDLVSVDKYAYTSPHVQWLFGETPSWPDSRNPASAGAYGWQQDRMEGFMSPPAAKPNWVFVETAKPFLTESGATTIRPEQVEGAVWNSLIHGASGIAYFQHNNNGQCGTYSLVDCSQAIKDKVRAINGDVRSLAPVLNTQGYVWTFGTGLETALKTYAGHAYVFAMTDGGTGSRTFTLPPGTTGDVEVVGEGRTLPVSGGRFTDSFAAEFSHHIYRVALATP